MPPIVFDLGGTRLRSAVAAPDGRLQAVTAERIAQLRDGLAAADVWNDVLSRMAGFIRRHREPDGAQNPVVLSFPGPIDATGRALSAPTIGGGADIPDIRQALAVMAGGSVRVMNDLSAAAWHVSRSVTGRFMVVTVSSGIGSKLFDPAIGVLDELPFAGEIGHGIVDESAAAPVCDCGGRGHLGAIASGRGIERLARRRAHTDPDAFARSACVRRFGATALTLANEAHLVPALRAGDPWAMEILTIASRFLARVLVNSIIVAGLRSVTLIGGFALAVGDPYLIVLRTAMEELCDYELLRDSIAERLTFGAFDEEACLQGAALYATASART